MLALLQGQCVGFHDTAELFTMVFFCPPSVAIFNSFDVASYVICHWMQTPMCIVLYWEGGSVLSLSCCVCLIFRWNADINSALYTSTGANKALHGAIRQSGQLLSMHRKLQTLTMNRTGGQ